MMLMFVLVFGLIIFNVIRGIAQTAKNVKSPIITVEAKVIAKRTNVSHHTNNTGVNNNATTTTSFNRV